MKCTKDTETETKELLQIMCRAINEEIDSFGLESMAVAALFLKFARATMIQPSRKVINIPGRVGKLIDGGRLTASAEFLDLYLFKNPSLTEERITQIETAFAFAIPTWSILDTEAADSAVMVLNSLALYYADLGDFGKWEGMSKRVQEMYMSCILQNQKTLALVIGDMGSRYAAFGRFDEAKGCLTEALTICDSESDLRTTLAPKFLSDSASIAIRRGEFVRARRLIARATELLEQAPAQDKRLQLSILIDSAWLLQVTGEINEFARVSLQAETVAKEVWESDPAGAVTSTIILIHCNQELGRSKEAIRLTQWLAGKLRGVAREAGVDVLDRFMEQARPGYGSKGLPGNLEEVVERIKAEQEFPTLP